MAYSNFIQHGTYQNWCSPQTESSSGNYAFSDMVAMANKSPGMENVLEPIRVSDEISDERIAFRSEDTMPSTKWLAGIKGTRLRFLIYGYNWLENETNSACISVFNGTSLMGSYDYFANCSNGWFPHVRAVSPTTQMLSFYSPYNQNYEGKPGCIILSRGTLTDGSQKVFLLAGVNIANTLKWYCENGNTGTVTLPTGVCNAAYGDHIALNKLCIPGVAVFDEVYTAIYRPDSDSQIINTAEGTFATMLGLSSYTQLYIKCPDE